MVGGEMEQQTHLIFMTFYPHFLLGFKILTKMSIYLILSMGVAQCNSVLCKVKLVYAGSVYLYLGIK